MSLTRSRVNSQVSRWAPTTVSITCWRSSRSVHTLVVSARLRVDCCIAASMRAFSRFGTRPNRTAEKSKRKYKISWCWPLNFKFYVDEIFKDFWFRVQTQICMKVQKRDHHPELSGTATNRNSHANRKSENEKNLGQKWKLFLILFNVKMRIVQIFSF